MNIQEFKCEVRSSQSSESKYYPAQDLGIQMELIPKTGDETSLCKTVNVKITNVSDQNFKGVIHVKLMMEEADPKFFMPGYMYHSNTAEKPSSGRKAFPRIKRNPGGKPESEFFFTRSDRLAEPISIVYGKGKAYESDNTLESDNALETGKVYGQGKVCGIAAPPYWMVENDNLIPVSFENGKVSNKTGKFYQYGGFSCNINDGGKVSVGYTLGYENAPWLFVQTANVLEREPVNDKNSFVIKAGQSVSFPMLVFEYEGEDETAIYKALEQTYNCFHEAPRTIQDMTEKKALSMLSGAIKDNAWLEEEQMYSGFVYDREKGPRFNKIGSLSWTNGLAVAVPMLYAAGHLKDEEMRRQSLCFIRNVVQNSYNPASKLLFDAVEDGKWSVRGWWYNGMHSGGHSAYLNGQAVYYILKAYLLEKDTYGEVHDDWIEFLRPVIRKMNEEVNSDYEYPFSMSEFTGAGLEYDSMGGAWCLAATALYEQITKDEEYLSLMKKSELHYFDTFVKKCECYGGPLDTDKAVDDEGILAYVRAVRILHEITKEEELLDHMKYALHYECSFKLCYNTPVSVKPLSEIGWSSCGGSITSVANPHIHPMSSTIIPEMRYYVTQRADEYITSRLEDTIKWSIQTFNTVDKEYGYGYPGWMSERFCFCQGLLTEKYPDGSPASTWFALMPWASASIIEGLAF